jgi:hypothetical protein
MEKESVVKDLFLAWEKEDQSLLWQKDDFEHISPNDHFKSKNDFLEACWKKPFTGNKIFIQDLLIEGNRAVVWYRMNDPQEGMPITEWIDFEGNLIKRARVFFG